MSYLYSNVLVRDLAADVNLVSLSNDCPRGQGQDHGELSPHIVADDLGSHVQLRRLLTRTAYNDASRRLAKTARLVVMCRRVKAIN